ncbi:MAG: M48 family metallopeptidase [Hasllibacter sp.]
MTSYSPKGTPGSLVLPGEPPVEVALRVNPRARRLTLRVGARGAALTRPPWVGAEEAARFARSREGWLRDRLGRRPGRAVPAPGATLPVEGAPRRIEAGPRTRLEADRLVLRGDPGRAAAGVLREVARGRLTAACDRFAGALGVEWGPLALRDTRSRWGSCSAEGRLMFSWRLAMAPPALLTYVAAHEVAHLRRMDHSPAFWAVVEGLCPTWRANRAALDALGPSLHAWDFG